MNTTSIALALFNLALIGLLPRVFFRKDGRLNVRWWLTAAPFFAAGAVLLLVGADVIEAGAGPSAAREVVAVVLHGCSIALIGLTIGSHRVPLALWHQDDDAPQELVTWGPYRLVRHPFYTAFVLCLTGCALAVPHIALVAILGYAAVALDITARREERRLLESQFGAEYRSYMASTGRLLPLVGRPS